MRRLIHYSKQPLTSVYSTPVEKQCARQGLGKPVGLWVSAEGEQDWKEWCESEQWGLDGFVHATEIVLAPKASILRLGSAKSIDNFHEEYNAIVFRYGGGLGVKTAIEWHRVMRKYAGIIIAPYIWERRLDGPASDWYYGWDCASGCIWNAESIAILRPIEMPVRKQPGQNDEKPCASGLVDGVASRPSRGRLRMTGCR